MSENTPQVPVFTPDQFAAAQKALEDVCWNIRHITPQRARNKIFDNPLENGSRILGGYVRAGLLSEERVRGALTEAARAGGHELTAIELGLASGLTPPQPVLTLRTIPTVETLFSFEETPKQIAQRKARAERKAAKKQAFIQAIAQAVWKVEFSLLTSLPFPHGPFGRVYSPDQAQASVPSPDPLPSGGPEYPRPE